MLEDTPAKYMLGATVVARDKPRDTSILAVCTMKNYVSFHMVTIYMCPESVEGISPELKKHKQGKGCFNFAQVDEKLFKELAGVVKGSVAACRKKDLLR